ncbi:uncharacterized protein LOC119188353 [Manduca sexta]|uniref:Uncharacterized protein n=1 Tax=Manduca sexta TaxID=7130 RepID=A0A921ZM18_MANSE|nr:uncharacterized protein LOC119188353 [Manduca sexta]XP_030033016.1 uncharacterized protein LOC119188353 [Manduca sexta]KAG6459256.1 hypothetical protein O3G_MSEX011285 [Manduca sexta]KAG6459257.1 hypothetical protein O3G_MSEX011285 [Manduca sexta]KAG6459258.1 hypothetical protein O3G_MSEX011285 [Manduca sexta]KAG6459259.1 hypothetical protein O3G_MSEX011285 [Manduca sexta]
MIILTGNSLNERHRELNTKVNQAVTNGVSFDEFKLQNEKTDIDRLFKIDLANKKKELDYIIETLKCGDSVYITRALKCQWLYQEEFAHIVNPDYLEQHVFPEMPFKMRRKFLKLISQHMTNSDRAALFCSYCIKMKLPEIALKFLWYAPESKKVEVIKDHHIFIAVKDMVNIVGDSFTVARTVLDEVNENEVCNLLKLLSYLYSVSDVKYLDLVEKYMFKHKLTWPCSQRFGLRLSKHIMKNHRNRLFCHTKLYLSMLNRKMLVKYSTADEVKKYVTNIISFYTFWDFYREYEFILEVIPLETRLHYLKEVFIKHHPEKEFEMSMEFYYAGLYKLMTNAEREAWALEHVESGLEHFGHGQDFKWFEFVSFDKAFEPLKKYILVAANADIRIDIVNVLVSSAQSDRELETLFNYYYQRFVNEMIRNKVKFIEKVLSTHSYHKFDENCWQAFNKILHSMDVYDNRNTYSCKAEYKLIAIVYAIVHKIELHNALKQHIDGRLNLNLLKQQTDKLPSENVEIIYNYMSNYYLQKINEFNIENYDENVKLGVRKYIHSLLELMIQYDKPKKDIPDIVMEFVALDREEYKDNSLLKEEEIPLTQFVLMKDLKKDASIVVSKITLLNKKLENKTRFSLAYLLRKLKIYFSTDIALNFVELFNKILSSDELCEEIYDAAVYGLFHLAEYADRVGLVTKYVPTESKIDHVEIERKILYIRKAICKFVCLSRPIVPLSETQKYIVGDYLKFCLPMFQSYAANLQPAVLREFVKFLLNSPASILKHGIRLAFECFSIHDLKITVTNIWKKMKNVSIRLVVYKEIHQKIVNDLQEELYETLKAFTLDVREDDDNELFTEMTKTQLPSHLLGDHILCTWQVLNTLPDIHIMIIRKTSVLRNMVDHFELMQQDAVESIVCEHITTMFNEGQMKRLDETYLRDFFNAKWNLTARYLMYLPSQEVLKRKLEIVDTLVKESTKSWRSEQANMYVFRGFLVGFVEVLSSKIFYNESTYCLHGIVILKQVLKDLLEAVPLPEIYDTIWYLRLTIIVANTIVDARRTLAEQDDSNNLVAFEQYIDNFAKEFAILFNEFVEENNCYTLANSIIIEFLETFARNLISNWPFKVNAKEEYVYTAVSSRLVEIEKYETYKFALEILPTEAADPCTHNKIIDKIKSFENDNIRYYYYKKFEDNEVLIEF